MNSIIQKNIKNSRSLIAESIGYLECGNACNKMAKEILDSKSKGFKGSLLIKVEKPVTGYLGSSALSYGMCLEVLLKSLIILSNYSSENVEIPFEHDLEKLFSRINDNYKRKIIDLFKSSNEIKEINKENRGNIKKIKKSGLVDNGMNYKKMYPVYESPIAFLQDSKNIFIRWRYYFEKKGNGDVISPKMINNFYIILNTVIADAINEIERKYLDLKEV